MQGNIILQSNGGQGLWVNASTGNQFFDIQSNGNTGDGVYVGTSTDEASDEATGAADHHR